MHDNKALTVSLLASQSAATSLQESKQQLLHITKELKASQDKVKSLQAVELTLRDENKIVSNSLTESQSTMQ